VGKAAGIAAQPDPGLLAPFSDLSQPSVPDAAGSTVFIPYASMPMFATNLAAMRNRTLVLALAAAFGLCGRLQAGPIIGSINFDGIDTTDTGTLGNASALSTIADTSVYPQELGSYALVPSGTPVTFTPFTLLAAGVTPLWTFTSGGLTYSFDATSIVVVKKTNGFLDLEGGGIASITGFDSTPGTWSITDTAVGTEKTFVFGEATSAVLPDTGMTALLLGLGLGAIALFRKQRST
jgi:hypothetical protein